MKNKLKRAVCLFGVFIASFLLTVTAFADNDFEVVNKSFIGLYKCLDTKNHPNSFIDARNDGYLQIKAYMDMDYYCHFSGFSTNWKISNSNPDNFWAKFDSVTRVHSDGSLVQPVSRLDNYIATGYVTIASLPSMKFIASKQSELIFMGTYSS